MNSEQTKIFRDQILISLRAYRQGLSLASLQSVLQTMGFKQAREEIESHVDYLERKNFLATKKQSHSLGYKVYEITAQGLDDLELREM